jgi:hypothetical protein
MTMRAVLPDKLEAGRIEGDRSWGGYGKFVVQGPCGEKLLIVASAADADDVPAQGWEHVSVSTRRRCPNWVEMCFVKDLFWNAKEAVVQFHPPSSRYINNHPFCLHLWRPKNVALPLPPDNLIGDPALGERNAYGELKAVEMIKR